MAQRLQRPAERSSAWRARRCLLLPMLPIFGLVGLLVAGLTLRALPGPVATVAVIGCWLVSLYHAAQHSRPGWVIGIAVVWPTLLAYWIYVGLRLDRPGSLSSR